MALHFLQLIRARFFNTLADTAIDVGVKNETNARLAIDAGGKLNWGDGTLGPDTNLYRSGANTLKTDDTLVAAAVGIGTTTPGHVLEVNGGIGVGNGSTSIIPRITGDSTGVVTRLFVTPESGNQQMNCFYYPSGTEDESSFQVRNSSDFNNFGRLMLRVNGSDAEIISNNVNSGVLPTTLAIGIGALNTVDDLVIKNNGFVGIGTRTPTENLDVVGNVKVSGTMVVGGNLTVNGTTTTINSTTVTIDDPIFTLGGDTAPTVDDNKDRGIEFRWHNGTSAKVGFFGLDDSTGKFIFIPDATNTSEVFSGTKGTIDANLEWADVLNKPTLFNWDTPQTLSTKTSSYTLLTADVGTAVMFDSSTAVNCTIDGSLNLTPGQRIDVIQLGTGQVTFVASSATVNATPGLKMRARYSAATIICVATGSYVVVGDLSA